MSSHNQNLVQSVRELYVWSSNRKSSNWFLSKVFELIEAAPDEDRNRLSVAFPYETEAFLRWESVPDKKRFFKEFGINPNMP